MATATTPDYLLLSQLCDRIPGTKGAKRLNPATAFRWAKRGIAGPNGPIRLRVLVSGRSMLTTWEWYLEFCAAVAASRGIAPPPRSPRERDRAADEAAVELAEMGI
jgi:hypothetical protein